MHKVIDHTIAAQVLALKSPPWCLKAVDGQYQTYYCSEASDNEKSLFSRIQEVK